jgi:hypothetical protein
MTYEFIDTRINPFIEEMEHREDRFKHYIDERAKARSMGSRGKFSHELSNWMVKFYEKELADIYTLFMNYQNN